jgi:hypothetical protein
MLIKIEMYENCFMLRMSKIEDLVQLSSSLIKMNFLTFPLDCKIVNIHNVMRKEESEWQGKVPILSSKKT